MSSVQPWLQWIKQVVLFLGLTAILFIFAAMKLPQLLIWLPTGVLVLGGLYLGFMTSSGDKSTALKWIKRIAGSCAIVGGLFIPLPSFGPGVVWEKYTPQLLEQAAKEKQPVLMIFSADWCAPCHELDFFTFRDPEVITALEPFKRLKVDLSNAEAEAAFAEMLARYEVSGIPIMIFLDSAGQEIREARIDGFIPARDLLAIVNSPRVVAVTGRVSEAPK